MWRSCNFFLILDFAAVWGSDGPTITLVATEDLLLIIYAFSSGKQSLLLYPGAKAEGEGGEGYFGIGLTFYINGVNIE